MCLALGWEYRLRESKQVNRLWRLRVQGPIYKTKGEGLVQDSEEKHYLAHSLISSVPKPSGAGRRLLLVEGRHSTVFVARKRSDHKASQRCVLRACCVAHIAHSASGA